MSFINLTKIEPAAPNDPNVNVVTQLNNNWDTINNILKKMQNSVDVANMITNPSINNIEIGQEVVSNDRFQIYTGSSWKVPVNIHSFWTAWTNIPLSANVAAQSGFTPQYRINTAIRYGELRGHLLKTAAAGAWTHNTAVIASAASGQPIASFTPITPTSFFVAASSPTDDNNNSSGARALITNSDGWRLTIEFRGAAGNGNWIALDSVHWWY